MTELRQRLARTVAPLDYRFLNDSAQPTDEESGSLARTELALPGLEVVGIRALVMKVWI